MLPAHQGRSKTRALGRRENPLAEARGNWRGRVLRPQPAMEPTGLGVVLRSSRALALVSIKTGIAERGSTIIEED